MTPAWQAAGLVHARVAFDPPPPSEDGRGAAVYLDVHDGHACVLIVHPRVLPFRGMLGRSCIAEN
ncbi:hypothetical protein M885DRAFT_526827 [Pelagophyceae sp. CCMP2097]|nr:hypothetical protein M885DRAFT_526827 [Pelagophyceae sp. CCMP2097]